MAKNIYFTIITPTINRTTLRQTCDSIDSQEFQEWEHLVISDGVDVARNRYKQDPRRGITITPKTNNYGNSQRHLASQLAKGRYILYLDDDDYYITPKALTLIHDHIEVNDSPPFGVFPATRMNARFFHIPPGASRTVSCQFWVKRGNYWPDVRANDQDYGVDGRYIEKLQKRYGASVLDCEELVEVNRISKGVFL